MSRIILNLISVFLIFDSNPLNSIDPTFLSYECETYIISTSGSPDQQTVPCSVWYDARADRPSEYFSETTMPDPGQVLMGCVYAYDAAGNRSECVAPVPELRLTASPCEEGPGVIGTCEDYVVSSPAAETVGAGMVGPRRTEPERVNRGSVGGKR